MSKARQAKHEKDAMYDSIFTMIEAQTVKAILTIHETGKLELSAYWVIAVLPDKAGITFGKNQTTENSGGLYNLVFVEYSNMEGAKFKGRFNKYKDILYKKGGEKSKMGALTDNEGFKKLLVRAAQEDPIFRKAQDITFHRNFFRPAVELAHEYDVQTALGLLIIYDMCIQSGPKGAGEMIEKFSENWVPPKRFDANGDNFIDDRDFTSEEEDELEWAWTTGLIVHRRKWLEGFKDSRNPKRARAIQNSAYRIKWIEKYLVEEGNSDLELPFTYASPYKKGKEQEINEENIYNVGG